MSHFFNEYSHIAGLWVIPVHSEAQDMNEGQYHGELCVVTEGWGRQHVLLRPSLLLGLVGWLGASPHPLLVKNSALLLGEDSRDGGGSGLGARMSRMDIWHLSPLYMGVFLYPAEITAWVLKSPVGPGTSALWTFALLHRMGSTLSLLAVILLLG